MQTREHLDNNAPRNALQAQNKQNTGRSKKHTLGKILRRSTRKQTKGLAKRRRVNKAQNNAKLTGKTGTKPVVKYTYEQLINAESAIGRTIFGPIPAGHRREFFEYRKNVWIWHESYVDPNGVMRDMTVRYEVRPNGVFKRAGSANYHKIEGSELDNFCRAAKTYLSLIKTHLYR